MMKVEQPALGDDLLARCASRAATYDRENRFFDEDFLLAQSSSPGRNNHTVNSALRSPRQVTRFHTCTVAPDAALTAFAVVFA